MRELDEDIAQAWEAPERTHINPVEARRNLASGKPFAMVHADHRALMALRHANGRPLLPWAAQQLLLALLARINWHDDLQGGIAATWLGTPKASHEIGVSETTISNCFELLGTGTYRERRMGGVEVRDVPGLGIIRKGTPDESAKVREHLPLQVGRPPTVWVMCDPQEWRLRLELRKQLEERRTAMGRERRSRETASQARLGQQR